MTELTGKVGFASPVTESRLSRCRSAVIELTATVALAVSLVVAATAVSIGVARAHTFAAVSDHAGAPFAIALCLGVSIAAMGGMTALAARERRPSRD